MPEPAPDPQHGVNVPPVSQKGADLITDQTAAMAQRNSIKNKVMIRILRVNLKTTKAEKSKDITTFHK
ncbi:hypothetical protein AV530_006087 [Patagioenas fasciata monilis]|uniref:Uncharacterized protein n=1 Tax=Patagioenas fasciata monilis TaxID=372326 RepID=A0A1V4J8P4_PATFA|nr:hypothetical protein AV530_006087 [Patagioenas fasciata monilis]